MLRLTTSIQKKSFVYGPLYCFFSFYYCVHLYLWAHFEDQFLQFLDYCSMIHQSSSENINLSDTAVFSSHRAIAFAVLDVLSA